MASHEYVIWSPYAQKDLENITDYLMYKWGVKVVDQYLNRLSHLINQIILNPEQYPLIQPKLNVRKCVVCKQNTLFTA